MVHGQRLDRSNEKAISVMKWSKQFKAEKGYSPSIREIAAKFSISTSVVRYYLNILEGEGYLLPRPFGTARVMQFTDKE